MEKKEVEIGNPVAIADITLIPIIEMSQCYWQRRAGISFFGLRQPLYVIMISPLERKAFKPSGEEVSLDELRREVPKIKELLDAI
jgi:hypothetical protein